VIALGSQRALFDVPDDVVYMNTANMAPPLRAVRAAGEEALARRATPWRITSDDWFTGVERLRDGFARVLGADCDGVALIPATSYGLAIAARNLDAQPGDQVVVLEDDYPSNRYTWVRFCERTGASLVVVEPGALVEHIGDRTRVVAVPNVHWTNGSLVDLVAAADAARRAGAALVVDASQSLGAMPLDLDAIRPDFLVAVGYKWMLGTLGLGCLYVAKQHRGGEPIEENWINRAGSEDFSALVDYTDAYRPGARRFDVGQHSNFGLVPMAVAATEQILEWTVAGIAESLAEVTEEIATRAGALGLAVPARDRRGPHMLGIEVPRDAAHVIARRLGEDGVVASVRGNSVRIAPHLHTTCTDVDRLIESLERGADAG
jgi:selenocysteine lyase/cysteine desulfurase